MGKVEYQEEDREGERWMCGIRLAAGLLGGAGQKQFTQNMVKIFNERNKTNIKWILLYLVSKCISAWSEGGESETGESINILD